MRRILHRCGRAGPAFRAEFRLLPQWNCRPADTTEQHIRPLLDVPMPGSLMTTLGPPWTFPPIRFGISVVRHTFANRDSFRTTGRASEIDVITPHLHRNAERVSEETAPLLSRSCHACSAKRTPNPGLDGRDRHDRDRQRRSRCSAWHRRVAQSARKGQPSIGIE
jgi:hypothetical protein